MQGAKVQEIDHLQAWLAKYTPVEQEIFAAREKRLANAAYRRSHNHRRFGDLCEATEGKAVVWRRRGTPLAEQVVWAEGDVWTLLCLARYHRQRAGRELDRLRHLVKRPLYYADENARRQALAQERRRITHRTTENPCPTREAILDAWIARRSSHAAAIRFGSLIEDLECYLDNTLLRDEAGNIIGRRGGIKRWLQTEIPALYLCYTTVMRYKAAAKKLRQITEIRDPTPASRIVEIPSAPQNGEHIAEAKTLDARTSFTNEGHLHPMPYYLLRARAIWREITTNVAPNPTALMARLDAFLDPENVNEANTLAEWRERYKNEITARTKSCGPRRQSVRAARLGIEGPCEVG